MQFYEKLYDLRKKAGMTQNDLAEKLNVSRQAVSRWEMGTAMPEIDNLIAMSDIFGVTLDYMLKEQEAQGLPGDDDEKEEKPEQKGSWLLLPLVMPFLGASALWYGWLFEKRILTFIGLGFVGLFLTALLIGLLVMAVLYFLKRRKNK